MKPTIRHPKSESTPKAENRISNWRQVVGRAFGFPACFGFRSSGFGFVLALISLVLVGCAATSSSTNAGASSVCLFTSFRERAPQGLRFLYSFDGYHWTNIPGRFLIPTVGKNKLLRDPSLLRGPDGTFHLVWTTGWRGDQGFGYAHSRDLIHWSAQRFIPVMTNEPTTVNVWAPELFYDAEGAADILSAENDSRTQKSASHNSAAPARTPQFIIVWASTIPGRFPDKLEATNNNHRLYFTTTRDFKSFAPARLFFDPGYSVIDGQIVKDGNRYVLVHKDNSRPMLNLRVAFGDSPLGPWRDISGPLTEQFTEGPSALKIGGDWLVYFDAYRKMYYGALRTDDFKTFTNISSEVSFPEGHKHGTALKVSREILEGLLKESATKSE